jgi:peroxiredoxin
MDSLTVGEPAPRFALPGLDGQVLRLEDQVGRITVLNFWSAECPWSAKADAAVQQAVQDAGAELWTIACCAGEPTETIRSAASTRGLAPVLLDPDQAVADRYHAQATPHIFVVDGRGTLRYRGAPDDADFGHPAPSRSYLAEALDALREGRDPDPRETPAQGCAITRRAPAA